MIIGGIILNSSYGKWNRGGIEPVNRDIMRDLPAWIIGAVRRIICRPANTIGARDEPVVRRMVEMNLIGAVRSTALVKIPLHVRSISAVITVIHKNQVADGPDLMSGGSADEYDRGNGS
jgi:hypothetical protein